MHNDHNSYQKTAQQKKTEGLAKLLSIAAMLFLFYLLFSIFFGNGVESEVVLNALLLLSLGHIIWSYMAGELFRNVKTIFLFGAMCFINYAFYW